MMTKQEIDCFRKDLDDQLKETFKDIDTNISYIIIGALGFFLTMLDKFFSVQKASFLWVAALSLISLLTAFIIWLYNKHRITKLAMRQLNYVDDVLLQNHNVDNEQKLLKLWKQSNKELEDGRKYVYIFLGIGVFLQVTFFAYNIMSIKPDDKQTEQKIKVEVFSSLDTSKTNLKVNTAIDTINTNK